MRIVIIGGTGLIGTKVVAKLCAQGHDAVPASPNNGVDILTGKGLAQAFAGADTVVDVSNSPSFDDDAVLTFFQTSTRNVLAAEAAEGVKHHVVLSVVGTDRLGESGYMRAKIAQETMVEESSRPRSARRRPRTKIAVQACCGADTMERRPRRRLLRCAPKPPIVIAS